MTGTEQQPFFLGGMYSTPYVEGELPDRFFTALFTDRNDVVVSRRPGFFFPVHVFLPPAKDGRKAIVSCHESSASDICAITQASAQAIGLDLSAPDRMVWVKDNGGLCKQLPAFTLVFDLPGGARVIALTCVGCVANQIGYNVICDRSKQMVDGQCVYGVREGEQTW